MEPFGPGGRRRSVGLHGDAKHYYIHNVSRCAVWAVALGVMLLAACASDQNSEVPAKPGTAISRASATTPAGLSFDNLNALRVDTLPRGPFSGVEALPVTTDAELADCEILESEWGVSLPAFEGEESICFVDLESVGPGVVRQSDADHATIGRLSSSELGSSVSGRAMDDLLEDGFTIVYAEIGNGPHSTPDEFEQGLQQQYGSDVVVVKPNFALVPLGAVTLDVRRAAEHHTIAYWDDQSANGTPVVLSAHSAHPPAILVAELTWSLSSQ